jgi:glyoxylate reductase
VLVTAALPDGASSALRAAGIEVVGGDPGRDLDATALLEAVAEFDGIVCQLRDTIDEQVLGAGAAGRLRVVGTVSVGVDHIDLVAAARLGVEVCHTPGVLDESTADLAFLLVLGASRLAWDAELELRQGRWGGWELTHRLGHDVHGAVLGLVGFGRIGRAVARRAYGFGMTVLHHARRDTGVDGFVARLDDLLGQVDVLSLHVPLTEATRHLIGRRELALLKPGAVLVNTARGPVVDEGALVDALESGSLFAAGLDVYEREPEIDPRLLAAPRTMLLPHIGSATGPTRLRMAQLACEGVLDVLSGRRPSHPARRW